MTCTVGIKEVDKGQNFLSLFVCGSIQNVIQTVTDKAMFPGYTRNAERVRLITGSGVDLSH